MASNSQHTFNAAQVADAVFTSIALRKGWEDNSHPHDPQTIDELIESIDSGLKTAGLSFAEYLERLRHLQQLTICKTNNRWRFSARERAVQYVDSVVAQLCTLIQHPKLDS